MPPGVPFPVERPPLTGRSTPGWLVPKGVTGPTVPRIPRTARPAEFREPLLDVALASLRNHALFCLPCCWSTHASTVPNESRPHFPENRFGLSPRPRCTSGCNHCKTLHSHSELPVAYRR